MPFAVLPRDADLPRIADAIFDITSSLHQELGNEKLSAAIKASVGHDVTAAAIRVFLGRHKRGIRYHKSNTTLAALYDYIFEEEGHSPKIQKQIASYKKILLRDVLKPNEALSELPISLALQFQDWLGTPAMDVAALATKLMRRTRKYVLLRKSMLGAEQDMYVKSLVSLTDIPDPKNLIGITHIHTDPYEVERISRGVLVPVGGNIYGILKVENGVGLDLLVFRDPVPERFENLFGFMTSIKANKEPFAATVIMEPYIAEDQRNRWADIPARFIPGKLTPELRSFADKRIGWLKKATPLEIPKPG